MTISNSRIKIINSFDPAVRDRDRLKNIFGFEYKIEIFVPESKRKWGYYVYPLLEGNKFVLMSCKIKLLDVLNFGSRRPSTFRWRVFLFHFFRVKKRKESKASFLLKKY